MDKFGLSQPVRRVEDLRFLRGTGRYVDDILPEGGLAAVFLRAPVAHGEIAALDTAEARAAPGVHLVLTGADLDAAIDNDMDAGQIPNRDGSMSVRPRRPVLATGRVRHLGEPVALIVADTVAAAKDAADLIEVDYDTLPCVIEGTEAEGAGQPQLHDAAPGNLCYDWGIGDEAATEAALAGAAHRVERDLVHNRVVANPMETRGCVADWADGHLTVHYNGQGVWDLKKELAKRLSLAPEAVTVHTPAVGGGFGMKAMNYPEYLACAAAARALDRPVKWMSERGEAFQSDAAGRDQVTRMTAGFDAGHRLVAMKVETLSAVGRCRRSASLSSADAATIAPTSTMPINANRF